MLDMHKKIYLQDIKQIRRTGYQLTPPVHLPMPTQTHNTSALSSLLSLLTPSPSSPLLLINPKAPKQVNVLSDKILFVCQSNKLAVIFYSVVDDRIQVQTRGCCLLQEEIIKSASTSSLQFTQADSCNYLVVQLSNLTLYLFAIYDYKPPAMLYEIKLGRKVLAMRFVEEKELVLVLEGGRLIFYLLRNKRLVEHQVLQINTKPKEEIKSVDICLFPNIKDKIYIFFTTKSFQNRKASLSLIEFLKIKRVMTTGKIYNQIFKDTVTEDMMKKLRVYAFQDTFFINNQNSLQVVQFKFGTYTRSDAITNLSTVFKMVVIQRHSHLFLCSFGQTQIQLCEIVVKQVGCKTRLLDVIQCDASSLANNQIASWIFRGSNRIELVFILDHDNRSIDFYLTRKGDKLKKLVERVRKVEDNKGTGKYAKRDFNAKVNEIQSLGQRLGFSRGELYLSVWQSNQKTAANIFQYLIPCLDFKVIIHELQGYLRVKQLTISQLVKILRTVEGQILKELTQRLEIDLILQYLKCNFQRRKLKLYSSDRKFDYEQYNRINQMGLMEFIRYSIDLTIFPEQFYHNILWKEEDNDTPLQISYILREFRLAILQDYPAFLISLLEPYEQDYLTVLKPYYFLLPQYPLKISIIREQLVKLSNIYPSERIEDRQHFWLGFISELQWQSEESSRNFLFKHLFDHYDTSYIKDRLNQMCQREVFKMKKNKEFVLIEKERQEFERGLPGIGEATSVLCLCEKINRRVMELGQPTQNQQLLILMAQNNKLPKQQFITFWRLCRLQLFLIEKKLLPKTVTIVELLGMSDIYIINLFFLGRRVNIDLMFRQFASLYNQYSQFTAIMQKYVESEDCSKVQLQILVQYIQMLPQEDIQKNMELIGILIQGFLVRVELREIDKAKDFYDLFKDLPLTNELLILLSVFDSIKSSCYPLLRQLGLGKLSYSTLITKVDEVIQLIVNNYFTNFYDSHKSIYIEGRQVCFAYPQNLFAIVLYCKDKIYSFRQEMQCYLSFGYWLVTWNQFDLIDDCFGAGLIIDGAEMLQPQFYLELVNHVLNRYFADSQRIYDPQTTEHLHQLLNLLDQDQPLRVAESAKIDLAIILTKLGFQVSLRYMEIVKQRWGEGRDERVATFLQIIDDFIDKVDFHMFRRLHQLLQTVRLGYVEREQKSEDMVQLAQYICRCLAKRGQYDQLCQIISFLNSGESLFMTDGNTMMECFLEMLARDELEGVKDLDICREYIDYYLTNWQQPKIINQLYEGKFSKYDIDSTKCSKIEVDTQFSKAKGVTISRTKLWEFVLERLKSKDQSILFNLSKVTERDRSKRSDKMYKSTMPRDPNVPQQRSFLLKYGMEGRDRSLRSLKTQKNIHLNKPTTSNRQLLYIYFFLSKALQDSSFMFNLSYLPFVHQKNTKMVDELSREDLCSEIDFAQVSLYYMRGLYKMYYISLLQSQRQPLGRSSQSSKEIEEVGKSSKQIDGFDHEKLILMIYEMTKDSSNEDVFISLRKMSTLFKIEHEQQIRKVIQNIYCANVATKMEGDAPQNKDIVKALFRRVDDHPLSISIANQEFNESQGQSHPKMSRYTQFQAIKHNYLMKSNITSEKILIEKVLLDLQERDSSRTDEKDCSIVQSKYEGPHQAEDAVSEWLMSELGQIGKVKIPGKDFNQLEKLLLAKQYATILEKYETKIIIKAINDYFYSGEPSRVYKSEQKTEKRLKRSLTNRAENQQNQGKLFLLMQILLNLQLTPNRDKIKSLRKHLAIFSTDEIKEMQYGLLMLFQLNVLLDPSKNAKKILKNLVDNATEMKFVEWSIFEKVVEVVDKFHRKCSENRGKEASKHHIAQIFLPYIRVLVGSDSQLKSKIQVVSKIVEMLGDEGLLEIHEPLQEILAGHHQILEAYIVSIYATFGEGQLKLK